MVARFLVLIIFSNVNDTRDEAEEEPMAGLIGSGQKHKKNLGKPIFDWTPFGAL